ncbi:MAG: leucine--tRNA ligase [Nanoarchaeota archaeon]
MEYNFKNIESKWQKKWEEKKVFEPEVDRKKQKFFFTTPYPYISGSLHLGHGRAVTESDIYSRYMRMKGFNVLYPMSFHITGTPVLGIAAAIKNKDKEKIKLYEDYVSAYVKDKKKVKSTVQSFSDPNNIVKFFIPKMIEEYKQLGLGVDWRRSFTSGDAEHQAMVTWQFRKYKENGYLTKEKHPVLYSIQDESAMGEDDIQDADSSPVEKMEFTLLKFKFKDKFLVAATLRPETIYGQTNLWINPKIVYWEIKIDDETWIVSEQCVEKLKYQGRNIKIIGKTKEHLLGKKVSASMINRELIILPSGFVDPDVGTGIVTSVPSDAPYDYVALREIQDNKELEKSYGFDFEQIEEIEEIDIIPIIKTKKYGDKAGVKVVEDAGIVLQNDKRLEALTQQVYKEGFHNGIMNENCGKYSGMGVKEAKEKVKEDLIKRKVADKMYETSRKAVSRSGGKIIVAVLDNQWFIDFNVQGWKKRAYDCLNKMEIVPENMKKQFEDTFEWLDKRPCARRRGLGTEFPYDKGWIIESLSDSTIYMTLYTINHIIRKNKIKKESLTSDFFDFVFLGDRKIGEVAKKIKVKEKVLEQLRESFEYWMPVDQRHTFLLHLSNHLSFMIFAFAGLFPEKYWPKKISFHGLVVSEGSKMSKSKGNVITLLHIKENYGADVFRFYLTNSTNVDSVFDWRQSEASNAKSSIEKIYYEMLEIIKKRKKGKTRPVFESKFNSIIKNATEKIEKMKFREYNSLVVFDMFRLVKDAKMILKDDELKAFYDLIIDKWVKLISPVCPHVSEEIWSKLGNKGFASLAEWPKADESKIDKKLEESEKAIGKFIDDVNNIAKIVKERGENVRKAFVYVIPNERDMYVENLPLIERKTNLIVKIFSVNDRNMHDPQGKAKKAKPGKPGIYLE